MFYRLRANLLFPDPSFQLLLLIQNLLLLFDLSLLLQLHLLPQLVLVLLPGLLRIRQLVGSLVSNIRASIR